MSSRANREMAFWKKNDISLDCNGCPQKINNRQYMTCSICKGTYDLICANVSFTRFQIMDPIKKLSWKCIACISKKPKGNNINTPVGSHNFTNAAGSNRNVIMKKRRVLRCLSLENLSFNSEVTDKSKDDTVNFSPSNSINLLDVSSAEPTRLKNEVQELTCHLVKAREEINNLLTENSELKSTIKVLREKNTSLNDNLTISPQKKDHAINQDTKQKNVEVVQKQTYKEVLIRHSTMSSPPNDNGFNSARQDLAVSSQPTKGSHITVEKKICKTKTHKNISNGENSIPHKKQQHPVQCQKRLNTPLLKSSVKSSASVTSCRTKEILTNKCPTQDSETPKMKSNNIQPRSAKPNNSNKDPLSKVPEKTVATIRKPKITIIGDQSCKELASKLITLRAQYKNARNYSITSLTYPDAPTEFILRNFKLKIEELHEDDWIILSLGSNDTNPAKLFEELSVFLQRYSKVKIVMTGIVYNRFLNEGKLNHELNTILNSFPHSQFLPITQIRGKKSLQGGKFIYKAVNNLINSCDYNSSYLNSNITKMMKTKPAPRLKPGTIPYYFNKMNDAISLKTSKNRLTFCSNVDVNSDKAPTPGTIPFYFQRQKVTSQISQSIDNNETNNSNNNSKQNQIDSTRFFLG